MAKMLVGKGLILSREHGGTFRVLLVRGMSESAQSAHIEIPRPPSSFMDLRRKVSAMPWRETLTGWGIELMVPITSRNRLVGYLGLGRRLNGSRFVRDDRNLIQSLVDLSGSAIEKALIIDQVNDANRNLDRKVQELNTLFELSKEFNAGLDLQKILRLITFALLGQVGVRTYAVCLRNGPAMEIAASRLAEGEELGGILPDLAELKGPMLTSDMLRMKSYRSAAAELMRLGLHAAVPMHIQNQTRGLLLVGERLRGGRYAQADLEFLYALGNLAGISIENARLFMEALEKQKMEDELLIARDIQQGLLPEVLPEVPGFDIAAMNIPSKQVGGDYYDVLPRKDDQYVFAIGDVSGKGTPAALLMANVQAALRALAPFDQPLAAITGRINDLTSANTRGGSKFITFFWGTLDTKERLLTYVNAGHNPPMLVRSDGTVERLEEGGLILGIFKTAKPYDEGSARMERGDVLFLFTDGVSEAMNAAGEDYTEEQLLEVVRASRGMTSAGIIEAVMKSVNRHVHDTPQSDDITMLVAKAV